MRQPHPFRRALALACALAATAGLARAQTHDDSTVGQAVAAKQATEIRRGDPARWHSEDTSRQSRLRILQKEIGAAYAEAKHACAKGAAGERSACLKEARATYEQDMKNAPRQLDEAPQGATRVERREITVGAGADAKQ